MKCSFVNLFRGVCIHFFAVATYLDFITLMTNQMVLPDSRKDRNTRGLCVRFASCNVVERRDWPHRNREHEFVDGIVQVWELLSPETYHDRYAHVDLTPTHYGPHRALPIAHEPLPHLPLAPPTQISKYKMAVFGLDKPTGLRCCLVVDSKLSRACIPSYTDHFAVGTDSYTIQSVTSKSSRSLEFLEKSEAKFRSIVYKAHSKESYPSFPISPDILTTQIKNSGIRTSSIVLQMDPEQSERHITSFYLYAS